MDEKNMIKLIYAYESASKLEGIISMLTHGGEIVHEDYVGIHYISDVIQAYSRFAGKEDSKTVDELFDILNADISREDKYNRLRAE